MINNKRSYFKKISLVLVVVAICTFVVNITDVFSQEYGSGNYCLGLNVNYEGGFSSSNVSSITVNNYNWTSQDDRFNSNSNDGTIWTIVVIAGKNGNNFPFVSTAGGLVIDDENDPNYPGYGTYDARPNPNDTDATNDDYIITVTLKDTWSGKGNMSLEQPICGSYGITITSGAPIEQPYHNVTSNVNITISGDELEYHYVANSDEADVTYFKFDINGGTEDERLVPFRFSNADYTYNDGEPPKNVSSVTTHEPIEYVYPYNDTGFVTFCVNGGGTDEYTSIKINGQEYASYAPDTKEEYWEALDGWAQKFCIPNVPYSDTYTVVVEGEQTADENKIPGFGWSYLSSDRSEDVTPENEGNFAHGRLEFVSASLTIDNELVEFDSAKAFNDYRYHDKGQIFQWNDGDKFYQEEDRRYAWGEAQLPYGTTITVRIVPDEGYQLTGLTVSPNGFTATNDPGVYTLTLNRTNLSYNEDNNQFNLNPTFTKVDSVAAVDSEAVSNVVITIANGDDAFQVGTPKLEVTDVVSMNQDRESSFVETAENDGYTVNNYLEISLYNTLYKGGKMNGEEYQSWDTEVKSLQNNATISLVLDEALDGSEVAVVHEVTVNNEIDHYDLIEGTYDADTRTVTFETDGFSTYAVVYKGENPNAPVQHTVTFKEFDDTEMFHILIDDGEVVDRPEDPQEPDEHTHFAGWYTNNTYEEEYDFNTPITKDTSIYALWAGEFGTSGFEVRFDSIGGDPVDTQVVEEGEYAVEPSPVPTKEGYTLEGWYLDEEFTIKFDFAKTPITDNVDLMAHWVRDYQNPDNYSINDENGNSIEFVEETNHTFTLTIVDFMTLPKEEVLSLSGLNSEQYDEYLTAVTNAVKESGTLIGLIGIDLVDNTTNSNIEDGPLTIKIKLTDEMKKYKSLKLVYVDDSNGFKTQTPIDLTIEGDYAVGTLKHLSFYAMTGSNPQTNNPITGDQVIFYVAMLGVSLGGLVILVASRKKKNNA